MTTTTIRQAGDPLERASAFGRIAQSIGALFVLVLLTLAVTAWLPETMPRSYTDADTKGLAPVIPTPRLVAPAQPTAIPMPTAAPVVPTAIPVVVPPPPAPPAPVVEQPIAPPAPAIMPAPATPAPPPWVFKNPPPDDSHGGRTNDHPAPPMQKDAAPRTGD